MTVFICVRACENNWTQKSHLVKSLQLPHKRIFYTCIIIIIISWSYVNVFVTSPQKYCDQHVCMSVCLSVRSYISKIASPNFTEFSLPVKNVVATRSFLCRFRFIFSAWFDIFLLGVESRGSGDGSPPWVQGQSPGRGLGTKSSRCWSILTHARHYFDNNWQLYCWNYFFYRIWCRRGTDCRDIAVKFSRCKACLMLFSWY